MGTKSKFFRAFVEGNKISDGRTITAGMIDEIVATFNRCLLYTSPSPRD